MHSHESRRTLIGSVLAALSILLPQAAAVSATTTLEVLPNAAAPGGSVDMCVTMSGSEGKVAGVQMNMTWDASCLSLGLGGGKAPCYSRVPKTLQTSVGKAPCGGNPNCVTMILFALDNTDPIPEGGIACCSFLVSDSPPSSCQVGLTNAIGSDPTGARLGVSPRGALLTIPQGGRDGGGGGGIVRPGGVSQPPPVLVVPGGGVAPPQQQAAPAQQQAAPAQQQAAPAQQQAAPAQQQAAPAQQQAAPAAGGGAPPVSGAAGLAAGAAAGAAQVLGGGVPGQPGAEALLGRTGTPGATTPTAAHSARTALPKQTPTPKQTPAKGTPVAQTPTPGKAQSPGVTPTAAAKPAAK